MKAPAPVPGATITKRVQDMNVLFRSGTKNMDQKQKERLEIERFIAREKLIPVRLINLIRAGKEGSRQWNLLERQYPQIFEKTLKEYNSGDWD